MSRSELSGFDGVGVEMSNASENVALGSYGLRDDGGPGVIGNGLGRVISWISDSGARDGRKGIEPRDNMVSKIRRDSLSRPEGQRAKTYLPSHLRSPL